MLPVAAKPDSKDPWEDVITAEEVHLVLFSASDEPPPNCCPGAGPNCELCQLERQQYSAWKQDPVNNPPPRYLPRLKTSVSGGPDGLPPEALSWARPKDPQETVEYRRSLCETLAKLFNRFRAEGRLPAEATACSTTRGPAGGREHGLPAQPDLRRGSLGGSIPGRRGRSSGEAEPAGMAAEARRHRMEDPAAGSHQRQGPLPLHHHRCRAQGARHLSRPRGAQGSRHRCQSRVHGRTGWCLTQERRGWISGNGP